MTVFRWVADCFFYVLDFQKQKERYWDPRIIQYDLYEMYDILQKDYLTWSYDGIGLLKPLILFLLWWYKISAPQRHGNDGNIRASYVGKILFYVDKNVITILVIDKAIPYLILATSTNW